MQNSSSSPNFGPSNAGDITLEKLQRTYAEFNERMKSFPYIPNPADITPEVWEALKSRSVMVSGMPINNFGITLHLRTDVPNWQLNECTCEKEKENGNES